MLRGKFKVEKISRETQGRRLVLRAVSGEENRPWSAFTPDGAFEISVTNSNCYPQIDAMNPGDLFYIDLTPA